jgi:hypothetical protein
MNRFGIRHLRGAQDVRDIPLALRTIRRSDANRFVGKPDMQGMQICFRVNRDGLDPHLFAGLNDTQSNFSTIGNQYFLKHIFRLV